MRPFLLQLLALVAVCGPVRAQQPDPSNRPLPDTVELEREIKRFMEVFALAEDHAADPVVLDQAFYGGAIPGMLRMLDPHTVFFDQGQFEQLKEMEKAVSKGFGSVVSVLPGRVIVLQTLPGAPASKAGLAAGDEILGINGYELARLEFEQLIQLLGAARQQPATLFVRRQGFPRLLEFRLVPEAMQTESVDRAFLLEPGTGYVRASSFDEKTGAQLREAIDKLGGNTLTALILDLRDNPGGVLTSALEAASLFLKPGQRLLSARGRLSEKEEQIEVPASAATPYTFKLAVLINFKTASAAEIVAGAVQDHDRGIVLGEPSFGKGLVQSVYPLSGGNGLALTTAFYYTPSGRSIQKPLRESALSAQTSTQRPVFKTAAGRPVRGGGGIEPDIFVNPPPQTRLRIAIEASGSLANFSTGYVQQHRNITRDFQVTPEVMDDFKQFLASRGIQPGLAEWSNDREWVRSRLRQEIFNQSIGVKAGDEIEVARDPVVLRAKEALASGKPL